MLSVRDRVAHCRNIGSGEAREIPVDDLVVARLFGEPIFPALLPVDRVQNGPDDAPWHTLIEADNYHALQLLEYIYAGEVDCIYIDPPYNTGARDWKYNNDYVDGNDTWQHSKWLSFMSKRLRLAENLLGPNGVLIVTIDGHEVHNLGVMLSQTLKRVREIQMVTIVTNTAGSMSPGKFSRAEEYAFFCFFGNAKPVPMGTDMLSDAKPLMQFWFPLFRSRGLNDRPSKRPNLVYPVAVDPETLKITNIGRSLKERFEAGEVTGDLDIWKPDLNETINGKPVVWPILDTYEITTWQVNTQSLLDLASKGFVRVRRSRNPTGPRPFTISYIKASNRNKILNGEVVISGREHNGAYILHSGTRTTIPKSTWKVPNHDARLYGTTMLRALLGQTSFTYPKSPYATKDALLTVLADKKNALIVDFFAGSGTTLQSVALLNNLDGGNRSCILVTNNEVSENEVKVLANKGHRTGDQEWEKHGICQSVTWPRSKYTILGKRDDGLELDGEYLTGKHIEKEKARKFHQIAFTSMDDLNTAAKKNQLVALIDDIPQSEVKKDSAFMVSEKHPASILFDDTQAEAWLDALEDQEHITDFYIVTASKATFDDLKARIHVLLGPVIVTEEEKRPMRDGFPANLEYFRLDFLNKDHVALGRQFREILPILWLGAGAIGPRPELPKNKPIPAMVIPEHNHFAVLVKEAAFAVFAAKFEGRDDLTHAYLVTDSEEAFQEMAGQLKVPNVIQLNRDYLENFVINKEESAS
ncbi:MAG: site-specific DNA-methyltransferase [Pseudomonadota bacterium]